MWHSPSITPLGFRHFGADGRTLPKIRSVSSRIPCPSNMGSRVGGTSLATLPMDVLQLILEHLCTSDIASLGRAVVALGSEPQLWLTPWLARVREDERTRRIGHWRLIGAANRPELLTLTEVDVSGRKIGPVLGLAIERAIHTAPALARLYLCGNALGAEGVGPIVRALANAPPPRSSPNVGRAPQCAPRPMNKYEGLP